MADTDKVEVDFAARDTATVSNTGAISLASDYQAGATLANNVNVVTGFEVDGSKLNSAAATVDIGYDGTNLTVTVKNSGGTTLNTATTTALAGGETFDNFGIKFTLDAVNFDATDVWDLNTINLSSTTTTTNTTVDASASFQIGANQSQSMSLGIYDMRASASGYHWFR